MYTIQFSSTTQSQPENISELSTLWMQLCCKLHIIIAKTTYSLTQTTTCDQISGFNMAYVLEGAKLITAETWGGGHVWQGQERGVIVL